MNRHCFRLIFSKSLGFLVPVAEISHIRRKNGQQQKSPSSIMSGSALALALASLPGLAAAEIVIDTSKRQSVTVISAPNGVPVIEISDPNRQGLSHNRFTEFDVVKPGVIFNNSLVNGTSQLGGALLRNPNLSRTARAILAEVTGNKPSSISGTLEVFGDKADILIAKGGHNIISGMLADVGTKKVEIVGHSDGATLGGMNAKDLSELVQQITPRSDGEQVRLVGCGTACAKDGASLVSDVSGLLQQQGLTTQVKGYETRVDVDAQGSEER